MRILQAKFRITTPMFMGEGTSARGDNAGRIQCAESVRPTAIKGALRNAWRALNWARIKAAHSADEPALKALHAEEGALFGLAAKGKTGPDEAPPQGQSGVLIRVKDQQVKKAATLTENCGELQYLLGMGLYDHKKGLLREYMVPGGEFTLELAMKPSLSEAQRGQLREALMWLGLTGSLGSRARKGFGSISLVSLTDSGEVVPLPESRQGYRETLERLVSPCRKIVGAPFSAVCAETRVQISESAKQPLDLLKAHGHQLALYRGYGRLDQATEQHRTLGKRAEANFADDHDWAYAIANGKQAKGLPRRVIFGLPHPYNLSRADNKRVKVEASTGRRGSPLFAHVHELPSGECLLVHLLLQSQFLPENEGVTVEGGKPNKRTRIDGRELSQSLDWGVVHEFLERFGQKEVIDG